MAQLLLVDDDTQVRLSTADWLRELGHAVTTAADLPSALSALNRRSFDAVICDVQLGGGNGFALLASCRKRSEPTPVVLLTGYATVETGIRALREGAADLVTKPFRDDELESAINRAVEGARKRNEVRRAYRPTQGSGSVVAQSAGMQRILETLDRVADADCPVLLCGESGTGKSLLARTLHQSSRRAARPLVEVACGALPESLLESELFGHTAGAFTGAIANRPGRFQQADGGTIFLDEIGTASLALQVKLLRVLQEKQFEPLGSCETQVIDARTVLATNDDLEQLVAEGRFRQDLFYRINVITIELPPLRQRREDIPALVQATLDRLGGPGAGERIDRRAVEVLGSYDWPGNIRELQNVLERAWLLKRGPRIELVDLPRNIAARHGRAEDDGSRLKQALADPERRIILETLERLDGNRLQAAQALGINRTTLYKKMKRLGLFQSN
jgi:DNA-binding NtrC family response regulator